ncbi:MAG: glycosyltransferase family 2 protein [Flavisolibacter sp.]
MNCASIIIVNYHSASLLINCIESLLKYTADINKEIIVVDNNSGDDSEQRVRALFPNIVWIQMTYNAGFARANNVGIRQSTGDTVLLLNPDVLFEDDSVHQCYSRLQQSSYVGAGVQLLNPDRTPQITGSYFIKGGINHFLPLPVLGKVFKWLGSTLKVKKTNVPEAKGAVEVDWINGAFLMVKKSAMEKAGLLDEDFFLYAEEIEWCSRLRRLGSFCVYGDLHAIHLQGATANETFGSAGKGYFNLFDKKGRQIMLSNFVRIRKQFGIAWFLFHLLIYLMEVPLFLLQLCLQNLIGKPRLSFGDFRGYCANLSTVLSLSPTIVRNKPHFYKVL